MEIKVKRVGFGETVGANRPEPNALQSIWNGIKLAFGGVLFLTVLAIAMIFASAMFALIVTISIVGTGLSLIFGNKNRQLRKGDPLHFDHPIFDTGDEKQEVDIEVITTPLDREQSALYRDAEHWEDKQ